MQANVGKRIFELLDPLYETGTTGSTGGWRSVLKEMSEIFSSGPAAIAGYSAANDTFDLIAGTYSDAAFSEYNDKFRLAGSFHSAITKMRPGESFWRKRDRPDAEYLKSDIYRNFFKREGVYDFVYFVLLDHKGCAFGVTFSRPNSRNPFTDEDVRQIEVLLPDLRRALRVYLCPQETRDENTRLIETLSKIPRSILFLDANARVVYSNEAALSGLARRDGLEMDRNGILFASLSKEEREFKALLASVLSSELDGVADNLGEVMPISRPSGQRPLQILISPFKTDFALGTSPLKLALLFVYDPEQKIETSEAFLSRMYGLTPAEARIAGLIAEGRSLREAGNLLGITQDTVRTHLKRIFAKTHTNRQTDLTTLILNSPAVLRNI